MTRRLTILGLFVFAGTVIPASSTLASTVHARLIAVPAERHRGGLIYLSGGGFRAHSQLWLEESCTGGQRPTYAAGPMADAHGSFVAFRVVAPTRLPVQSSRCSIYATRAMGGKPLTGEVPARYTVVPSGRGLSPCSRHMCAGVNAVLVLTQHGAQGNLVINAWPGAVASAAVLYPGGSVKYRGVKIGWQGSGAVRVRIAKRIKGAMRTHVYATAVLGSNSGTASTDFMVLPNR